MIVNTCKTGYNQFSNSILWFRGNKKRNKFYKNLDILFCIFSAHQHGDIILFRHFVDHPFGIELDAAVWTRFVFLGYSLEIFSYSGLKKDK